ncbi:hypothetical protein AB0H49_13615 [Nocardia sp. NPDC050713]|uniref:hypothetical protein n=1 Tax=Nocardia sp. NPDC050713 TaxID=3154511 RepID=UPI0033D1C8AD
MSIIQTAAELTNTDGAFSLPIHGHSANSHDSPKATTKNTTKSLRRTIIRFPPLAIPGPWQRLNLAMRGSCYRLSEIYHQPPGRRILLLRSAFRAACGAAGAEWLAAERFKPLDTVFIHRAKASAGRPSSCARASSTGSECRAAFLSNERHGGTVKRRATAGCGPAGPF